MIYLTHLSLGFLMGFIGLLPPGMINMTTVRTTLENGKTSGKMFAAGGALIVMVQASIALLFAHYLKQHPTIIEQLSIIGIFVFLGLSVFFFIKGNQKFKGEGKKNAGNFFLKGMLMSSLNMLAIPFYLGWSTVLTTNNWMTMTKPLIILFVIGTSIGAFALFYTYSLFAIKIENKAHFLARNINFSISVLFFFLGCFAIIQSV